jgi:PAS domain S-box-containing protein
MRCSLSVRLIFPVVICALAYSPAKAAPNAFDALGLTPQEKVWLSAHPVITVAPDPDFPPIEWFDKKGEFTGIASEYVSIVGKSLGVQFKIMRCASWNEILQKAKERKIDMLSAASQTPLRSEYLLFSRPHSVMPGVIITRKGDWDNITVRKLSGMTVAIVSGYVWQEFIARDLPDIKLDPVRDVQTGLRKVSFGMDDAMIENIATATDCIEKEGITNLKIAGETGYFTRLSFASRKDWPELNAILDKALTAIPEDVKKAVYRHWVHLERQPVVSARNFRIIFVSVFFGTFFLIVAILAWNRSLTRQVGQRTRALKESEQKFLEMVENANSIILRMDTTGTISFFNKFAQDFFKFAKEEIIGKNVVGTIVPASDTAGHDLASFITDLCAHPDKYVRNENENCKSTGERVWISWTNKPIFDANGMFTELLCVGNDITELKRVETELERHRVSLEEKVRERTVELSLTIDRLEREVSDRRRAENALVESERRYRFLFDGSPAGSVIIGPDGMIREINRSFEENLGYNRSEIVGKPALSFIAASDKDRVSGMIAKRFRDEKVSEEIDTPIIAKDGTVHYINFAGGQAHLYDRDAFVGILVTGVDVTERRRAEVLARQQEEKLVQADKMATLGILVSGVAHEINNPNNFIILNSDNIADIWKGALPVLDAHREQQGDFMLAGLRFSEIRDEIEPLIKGISDGAKRIRNIVQNLKDFARQEPGNMDQPVSIDAVVDAAAMILGNLIKKSTDHFTFVSEPGVPAVRCAFQKIEQVVINLVTNACQALTSRGQAVTVATSHDSRAGRVVISVRDEGTGISPENLTQIMNPFFTTKRDTGGTGLGLSISYSIVKDHGGDMTIESELGKGTVATVSLPVAR